MTDSTQLDERAKELPAILNEVADAIASLTTEKEEAEKRLADAWDEGALWAAAEIGVIESERERWLTPSDNPYRTEGDKTDE